MGRNKRKKGPSKNKEKRWWDFVCIDVTRTIKLPILFHGSTHDLLSGFTSISTVSRCQSWLLRKQLVIIYQQLFDQKEDPIWAFDEQINPFLNNDNFLQLFSAREPSMKNLFRDGIPISTIVLMAFKVIDQKLQARVPKLPSFTYAIHWYCPRVSQRCTWLRAYIYNTSRSRFLTVKLSFLFMIMFSSFFFFVHNIKFSFKRNLHLLFLMT